MFKPTLITRFGGFAAVFALLSLLLALSVLANNNEQPPAASIRTATRSVERPAHDHYYGGHDHVHGAGGGGGHDHSHGGHDHDHGGGGHDHSHDGQPHGGHDYHARYESHEEEHVHDQKGGHDHSHSHSHAHGGHGDHGHLHSDGDSKAAPGVGATGNSKELPAPLIALSALLVLPYLGSSLIAPLLSRLPPAATNVALCFAGGSVVAEVWLHGVGDRLNGHSHDHGHGAGHSHSHSHVQGGLGYPESVLLGILLFFGLSKVLDAIVSGGHSHSHGHHHEEHAHSHDHDEKHKEDHSHSHNDAKPKPAESKSLSDSPAAGVRRRTRAAAAAAASETPSKSHENEHDHDHHDHDHSDHSHSHSHSSSPQIQQTSLTLHYISTATHSSLDALALSIAFFSSTQPPWAALAAVLLHELPHRLSSLLIAKKYGGNGATDSRWAAMGTMIGWFAGVFFAHLGKDAGGELLPGIASGAMLYVGMVGVLGELAGHSHGHDHGEQGEEGKMMGALGEVVGLGLGMWSAGLIGHEH